MCASILSMIISIIYMPIYLTYQYSISPSRTLLRPILPPCWIYGIILCSLVLIIKSRFLSCLVLVFSFHIFQYHFASFECDNIDILCVCLYPPSFHFFFHFALLNFCANRSDIKKLKKSIHTKTLLTHIISV